MTSRTELKALMLCQQMAVALNPRYKKLTFLRRTKREAVWTALLIAFRVFYDRKHRAGRPTEEINSETRSPVPKRRTLTLLMSYSESAVLSYYYYYTLLLIPGFSQFLNK